MRIALDLDNTLVSYDALFRQAALDRGLAPPEIAASKSAVRAHVWRTVGDEPWQELQAECYGPRMAQALPMPGADRFLRRAGEAGATLCIVSHKTRYARRDTTRTDLRQAALEWLAARGWLDDPAIPLERSRVFFEDTRREKVERVLALGCAVLVDDLPEVLADEALGGVRRVLIAPEGGPAPDGAVACGDWKEIGDHVFGR
ncbi:hypothetical protein NNJEOMEG_02800 [Fundidesulfovibrio magnetotacticus]|uniref:Haloacid dehalogenase-like hydrolase n=1 Tax=Fundidesulfovibrio magnetotacticus TaxID=2730080 RepID=A0A6V8LR26_9BACT|nr:hypothetical protein [Fundidesulfovibrio magnetotacticus]GFK94952.1 hypothetical protein NNJEOMEG_02800 [Fundidesulfovibrio magnetotacticus]